MSRKSQHLVTLVLIGAMPGFIAGADADERPNLVVIIADDMNWNDCGAYGHPAIRTPNIDKLALSGLRFKHAYLTTSSCSPSRSSIVTGKYPHNTGAEQLHWPLPAGSTTFAGKLQQLGYYTAAAGKWHLGSAVQDHFDRIYSASTAGFVLPSGKQDQPAKMVAKHPSGCESWEQAIADCPPDQPFFLWLASLDPHRAYTEGTLDPPHRSEDVVVPRHLPDTPEVREDLRQYYDEIGRLDSYVGKVVAKLNECGVAENTLVLFMTDNGRPFPRDKTTLYDGGIRTPWIVRWPDEVSSGATTDALVSAVDIAPTFLELAGATPDGMQSLGLEGESFAAVLRDPTAGHREVAFAEDHWHDYEDHARCVISQQYKLIRNDYVDLPPTPPADAGRGASWLCMQRLQAEGKLSAAQQSCFHAPRPQWELYDLTRDPGELNNVVDSPAYASVLSRMKQALADWSQQTSDFLPTRRTPDEFDRATGQPDPTTRKRPRPSKLEMFGTTGNY